MRILTSALASVLFVGAGQLDQCRTAGTLSVLPALMPACSHHPSPMLHTAHQHLQRTLMKVDAWQVLEQQRRNEERALVEGAARRREQAARAEEHKKEQV